MEPVSSSRAAAHLRGSVVSLLGVALARRAISVPNESVVKANLASALRVAPGWLNLDASLNAVAAHLPTSLQRLAYRMSGSHAHYSLHEYLGILAVNDFVFCDLRRGLPMPSGSLDFVYTSHLLEHLERSEALALLRDVARVMKPHATLRIVVPDLAHFVTLYQEGERRLAVDAMFSADAGGRLAQHRYMYDETGLRELLMEAGFRKVVRCEPGQGETPDLEILDTRPEESLFVEAWVSGFETITSSR